MSKISAEILDEYRDRYPEPEYDQRYRAGRMAEEIELLRDQNKELKSIKLYVETLQIVAEMEKEPNMGKRVKMFSAFLSGNNISIDRKI